MTELQAERGEGLSAPPIEVKSKRLRYIDLLIAIAAFAVLASLPFLFSSKALLDFVIRCAAFGLFATSLNLLVGYTGMISFGHGMFFGLGAYGFGLIMQRTGVPVPVAFLGTLVLTAVVATVIGAICVRLKEIYFAFVTLAFQMLIHSIILSWVSLTGGDQGLRGGIPRPEFLRHRSDQPCASVHHELRAAGDRTAADASDRAIAVRLYLAHDPRQCQPGQLHRHRRLARQTDHLRAVVAVCLHRRHHHVPVRVGRLSRIRLLDDIGRGHLHQSARRRHHVPRPDGRHRAAVDPQRHRHAPDRALRDRARHRYPVFRDRPAKGPDGFRRRMVRGRGEATRSARR